jgi:8-oxo-dGTP pyrophosphatase MutT (NUDIX family)
MPMSPHMAAIRAQVGHDLLTATAAAVAVFDDDARILLVRLADMGTWGPPGGAIDPNELPADAAVRECWEETGLLVEPTRVVGIFGGPEFLIQYPNGDLTYYTVIVFEARKISGTCLADGIETLDVKYFTREECQHISMTAAHRLILDHSFRFTGAPFFTPSEWRPSQADDPLRT